MCILYQEKRQKQIILNVFYKTFNENKYDVL